MPRAPSTRSLAVFAFVFVFAFYSATLIVPVYAESSKGAKAAKRPDQPAGKRPSSPPADKPQLRTAVTVFANGQDGYKIFRIPAIVRASNGDLLAFCEAREGGDASEIDLVLKRSTDGGVRWGKLQVVQDSEDFRDYLPQAARSAVTVGNPAPVVDLLHPTNPGRIHLPFTLENDRVFVTHSDDHGKNWSSPREITMAVKRKTWGWYATGPVHSIQIQAGKHRGRLVTPADHRQGTAGADKGPNGAQAVISDDHGETWRLGAVDDKYDDGMHANETAVVELDDGRLYFNTRDQHGAAAGTRGEAYSSDGGETFDDQSPYGRFFAPAAPRLDAPVVQCALLRARSTSPKRKARDVILFSGPDESGPSGKGRSDLRIRYSRDMTETWHDGPIIHEGPAAYSDMTWVNEALYGVLYEAGKAGQSRYTRIDFRPFTLEDLGIEP